MICKMPRLAEVQHRRGDAARGAPAWASTLWRAATALTAAIVLTLAFAANPATAAEAGAAETTAVSGPLLSRCVGQTYALCASSECTVFNGVTYCVCRVRHGTSVSLTQQFGDQNVCDINAEGVGNGFMVSTYSPPPQLLAPSGDLAVYHCTGNASSGAYAQCDGGLCYRSTQGQFFPGFEDKLQADQIICSCPVVTPGIVAQKVGHEILGPYPCDDSWFQYCDKAVSNSNNASTLYVGIATTHGFEYATNRFLRQQVSLRTCTPPTN